jgi:hypothetical protein
MVSKRSSLTPLPIHIGHSLASFGRLGKRGTYRNTDLRIAGKGSNSTQSKTLASFT